MNGFQSHQPGVPISLFPYVGPRVTFRDWLHSNHARAYVHSLTNIYTGRAGQGGGLQECSLLQGICISDASLDFLDSPATTPIFFSDYTPLPITGICFS